MPVYLWLGEGRVENNDVLEDTESWVILAFQILL